MNKADEPSSGAPSLTSEPPSEPWEVPRRRRLRWPAKLGLGAAAVFVVVAVACIFIRLPYVIVSPGNATPVDRVVRISGAPTFPDRGSLLFLTVSVTNGRPNVYRTLVGWLSKNQDVEPERDELGCLSRAEDDRQNVMLMDDSQQVAKAVALGRLGYTVGERSAGPLVFDIDPSSPACGKLRVGDRILAVDGTPVANATAIGPLVRAHSPGQSVRFTIQRDNQPRQDVVVGTKALPAGPDKGKAFVGISPADDVKFAFPPGVNVSIDPGPVTGPSAGLAFTLTLLDKLTPGSLTGGRDVAVTGTIELNGDVGDVGGVAQKAVTARNAGAKLFLVPVSEVATARQHAGSMKIVGVRTIEDALRALHDAGGATVPPPPTTTSTSSPVVVPG
jgi:PDZ domain-containing protein